MLFFFSNYLVTKKNSFKVTVIFITEHLNSEVLKKIKQKYVKNKELLIKVSNIAV